MKVKCLSLRHALLDVNKSTSIDLEFAKKNIFSVLESFIEILAPENVTLNLVSELKRCKFKLPESSSYSIYQILFKSVKSIYSTQKYFGLFMQQFLTLKQFIEAFLMPKTTDWFHLAPTGEHKLIVNYICIGILANTVKLFQCQQHIRSVHSCVFQFLKNIFDLFNSVVNFLGTNAIGTFDFALSCFVWNFLSLLSILGLEFIELKEEMLTKMVEISRNLSKHSNRFKRVLKFIANSAQLKGKNVIMENLVPAGIKIELTESLNCEQELEECLSSSDIMSKHTFKYILTYMVQVLFLGEKDKITNAQLNRLVRFILVRELDDELKELVSLCFSLIGPVCNEELDQIDYEKSTNSETIRRNFLMDKFESGQSSNGDQSSIYNSFYLTLFEHLFDSLMDEK